jgi:hypothetical protein
VADRYSVFLAHGYARRLPKEWWIDAQRAVAGHRLDPVLLASVIAVEAGNRPRLVRWAENAFALILVTVRACKRFGRLSLGIAQIAPRRLGLPCARATVMVLNTPSEAMSACASIVKQSSTYGLAGDEGHSVSTRLAANASSSETACSRPSWARWP